MKGAAILQESVRGAGAGAGWIRYEYFDYCRGTIE